MSMKLPSFLYKILKNSNNILQRVFDILFSPFTIIFAYLFRYYRKNSLKKFPISKKIFLKIGVLPIADHYYEPLFNPKHLRYSLKNERTLLGIDFNDQEQLEILSRFNYNEELLTFPLNSSNKITREYQYNVGSFLSGDAEYLYNMIRLYNPKNIIEIGSGSSTLMAQNAIKKNNSVIPNLICDHICIEPYEQKWLEEIGVKVIREKVENVGLDIFKKLNCNDILFIDSSHIIRPQGDVLFEYLEILPSLNKGVIIHIHDIFSPRDYLEEWFGDRLWNEQYLLEAFLSFNKEFRIIGATNYLSHKYNEQFSSKCPVFKVQKNREPGSFYIMKN